MTFPDLSSIEDSSPDIHSTGRGMEFWSDGEYARFGFDVREGTCVEIGLEDIEEFSDEIEKCETGHFSFSGRMGQNRYLFEEDHPGVHVYYNQKHVASFVDYEKYPLPNICRRVREDRIDWDVETVARKMVEKHTSSIDDTQIKKLNQHIAEVKVKSNFLRVDQMVRLCSTEHIQRGYYPEKIEISSFDDFTTHTKRFLNNVQVKPNDDGGVEYILKLDTREYKSRYED